MNSIDHNNMLDDAEKEYLYNKKIDELRAEVVELEKEVKFHIECRMKPHSFHYCRDGRISTYPNVLCSICRGGEDFIAKDKIAELQTELTAIKERMSEGNLYHIIKNRSNPKDIARVISELL